MSNCGAWGEAWTRQSLHALYVLAAQPRPGGARLHPGSLGEVAESAGIVLLEPVDRLRRGFDGGDAVIFGEPRALAQGPLAHVGDQALADREIDVDVHSARLRRGALTARGVTQAPPREGQVAIPAAGNADFARRAEQCFGGAVRERVGPGRGHREAPSRYPVPGPADSLDLRDDGALAALRQVARDLGEPRRGAASAGIEVTRGAPGALQRLGQDLLGGRGIGEEGVHAGVQREPVALAELFVSAAVASGHAFHELSVRHWQASHGQPSEVGVVPARATAAQTAQLSRSRKTDAG